MDWRIRALRNLLIAGTACFVLAGCQTQQSGAEDTSTTSATTQTTTEAESDTSSHSGDTTETSTVDAQTSSQEGDGK